MRSPVFIQATCCDCGNEANVYARSRRCRACTLKLKASLGWQVPGFKLPEAREKKSKEQTNTQEKTGYTRPPVDLKLTLDPDLFHSFKVVARNHGRSVEDHLMIMMYREIGALK